jgi:hypothetical protein
MSSEPYAADDPLAVSLIAALQKRVTELEAALDECRGPQLDRWQSGYEAGYAARVREERQ